MEKPYVERLTLKERVKFILDKIAESSNYGVATDYFALFDSPEVPTTVDEIKELC